MSNYDTTIFQQMLELTYDFRHMDSLTLIELTREAVETSRIASRLVGRVGLELTRRGAVTDRELARQVGVSKHTVSSMKWLEGALEGLELPSYVSINVRQKLATHPKQKEMVSYIQEKNPSNREIISLLTNSW